MSIMRAQIVNTGRSKWLSNSLKVVAIVTKNKQSLKFCCLIRFTVITMHLKFIREGGKGERIFYTGNLDSKDTVVFNSQ